MKLIDPKRLKDKELSKRILDFINDRPVNFCRSVLDTDPVVWRNKGEGVLVFLESGEKKEFYRENLIKTGEAFIQELMKHGGARKGAGRKKGEPTKVMRIPKSKVEDVKTLLKAKP